MINANRSTSTRRLFVSTLRMCCVLVMIGASALCWDSFVAVKAKSPSYALSLPATGSITASPNPMQVCDGTGLGITTLSWTSTGTSTVEVHVSSPSGTLFASSGPSGSGATGKWVGQGTQFFLQDVSGGLPLTSANTIATVTVGLTTAGCAPGTQWTTPDANGNINSTNTGNVGIGTTSPGGNIDVRDSTGRQLLLTNSTSGNSSFLNAAVNAHVSGNLYFNQTNWNRFDISKGGAIIAARGDLGVIDFLLASPGANPIASFTTAMRIDNSGKVGIGTTTPLGPLDVRLTPNDIYAGLLVNYSVNNGTYLRAGSASVGDVHLGDIFTRNVLLGELGGVKVGIGTNAPTTSLDVAGQIR